MKVLVTDYAWPDLEVEQVVLGEIGIELLMHPTVKRTHWRIWPVE